MESSLLPEILLIFQWIAFLIGLTPSSIVSPLDAINSLFRRICCSLPSFHSLSSVQRPFHAPFPSPGPNAVRFPLITQLERTHLLKSGFPSMFGSRILSTPGRSLRSSASLRIVGVFRSSESVLSTAPMRQ